MNQSPEEYILACMELLFYLPKNNEVTELEGGILEIDHALNLRRTPITALPEGLSVRGSLYLWGCDHLKSLPDNLEVDHYLYLDECTLYPFDESKYKIEGEYNIIPNSLQFIMED